MLDGLRRNWDAALAGAAVLLFHLVHLPRVAHATIFYKSNLAFDFDIDRFVPLWCASPFPLDQNDNYYAVRHPLAVLMRAVCVPLAHAGLDEHIAACIIAAVCAAASAVFAYAIARELGLKRCLAGVLTAMWAVSTTSLFLGVLPETYDLASIALAWQFLLAIRWIKGQEPRLATRIAAAIVNFGITITNVALSGLAELVCRLNRQPPRDAIKGTAGFSAAVAVIALALSATSLSIWPTTSAGPSVGAVKQVYWDATSAEKTSQRQSAVQVAWTFGATAFVTPRLARYPTGVPGNPYLWDARGQDYSAVGWIAVLGWLALLLLGVGAAAGDRQLRPVWIIAGVWIAGNIALHSYWQFRDTVFLYAAHSHMAFFLPVLAGAAWAQRQRFALPYTIFAALLLAAIAFNNIPAYLSLAHLN